MNLFAQLREYIISSRKELEAVHWPTRQETFRYSALVIGVSVIFAIFFGALDFGLNSLVQVFVANQPAPTQQEQLPDITPTAEVNPVEVEATTASGTPAEIKIVPTPSAPTTTK